MRKLPAYLLAILIGGIIWFFFSHFKIEGTNSIRVVPKTEEELNRIAGGIDGEDITGRQIGGGGGFFGGWRDAVSTVVKKPDSVSRPVGNQFPDGNFPTTGANLLPKKRSEETIQIGSFHLYHFGSSAADPLSVQVAANVIRHFDVVALQGVMPTGTAALNELAKLAGPNYEAIAGVPGEVQHQDEHFAYIYDRTTIVADKDVGLYTLGDVDNLLKREPLIGWFRAKKAPVDEAFTFSLVNVNTDQRRIRQELDVLDNAMHEIRNDGREEDDVILLGNFQAAHNELGQLGQVSSIVKAIVKPTTDLLGKTQTENILFRSTATDEYTGRSGVFQFLRAFNLNLSQAHEVSSYLPVWAEFSIYETGQPGRIAAETEVETQR